MNVLVIGYGNPLRADDGLGWHAASALARDPRLAAAVVLQRHQLTPELALDVAAASFVIFIDARVPTAGEPGRIQIDAVAAAPAPGTWTHHMTPEALLHLTRRLTGLVPPAVLVTAVAGVVEVSDQLSPAGRVALTGLVETVAGLARHRSGEPAGGADARVAREARR